MALQRGARVLKRAARLVAGGAAAALLLTGAAAGTAGVATQGGGGLLRRLAVDALRKNVNGRVAIGSVGGSLVSAVELTDVTLSDSAGRPVITVPRVRVRYGLTDVLRGRYRLSAVELVRPVVVLDKDAAGQWSVVRLFRREGPREPRSGPAPLVEFQNVRIVNATLVLRHRTGERVVDRTVRGLTADLARLRASHPDSSGVVATVRRLLAQVDDPELNVRGGRGLFAVVGDTLHFDFDRFQLPGTTAALQGRIVFGGRTKADVEIRAAPFAFADVRGAVRQLPGDGGGRVAGRFRRSASGAMEIDVREAEFETGTSAVRGRVRVLIDAERKIALQGLDVTVTPFELALLRPWLDTLPVRGRVRGRVRGDGPVRDFTLRADVAWTDADVPGAPTNFVRAAGGLGIGGADEVFFQGLSLERVDLDFRTVRRYLPAARLTGRLGAVGRLSGGWRRGTFEGTALHSSDGDSLTRTRLGGSIAWALGDSVRLDAELVAESLSLDLLKRSFPAIPLSGSLGGTVKLHGWLSALAVGFDLGGGGITAGGTGTLGIGGDVTRLVLQGIADSVDLRRHRHDLPPTRLGGQWSVALEVPNDTARRTTGSVRLSLWRSVVAGVEVLRAGLLLQLRPQHLEFDSLRLESPGATLAASGSVARGAAASGQLGLAVRADTLAVFEPLARWLTLSRGDTTPVRLDGGLIADLRFGGSTERWELAGTLAAGQAAYGGAHVEGLRVQGSVSRADGAVSLDARLSADSVALGPLAYAPLGVEARGRFDSLSASVSGGFAPASGLRGRVRIWGDSLARTIGIDALRFELPARALELARPTTILLTPESVAVDSLELRPERAGGRLFADGSLPLLGVGDFTLFADSVPLADLFALAGRDTAGIGGRVDLTWHVSGPAATPHMELGAALTDGRFGDYRAPLTQVLAHYGDRHLTLKGGLWRGDVRLVTLSGSLPIDLALEDVERRTLPGAIAIQARSDSVDMAVLDPLTDLLSGLAGTVSLSVGVAGTWDEPSLSGFVDVREGALTIPALGARYDHMDVRLDLVDSVVRVSRALLYGGEGALDVSGEMRLQEGGGMPQLDLTLRANRFAAFDVRQFGALTGTGALTLRGPVLGAVLSGRLVVDGGYLKFADLVQKRIVNLDDPEFRAIVDTSLARASGLGPDPETIFLDSLRVSGLVVRMGDDVWLRSTEANIQLDGEFTMDRWVEDRIQRYRMDGTMRAVRGSYRLTFGPVAREFRVTQGTVRFFGTPEFNPDMDITAEHEVRTADRKEFVVQALIGGTLLYPRLTLASDERPPLSETEIASYLVFGQPLSALANSQSGSALSQVGLLSQTAAGIAGSVGQGLIAELGLPLDYLTLMPGSGQRGLATARIGAGAQIGGRTFLTVTAGLCEVRTQQALGAGVEYRFSRMWSVEAAFEPVIQECGTSYQMRGLTSRYQLSFDLHWQVGSR